jgi:hypothetical protein
MKTVNDISDSTVISNKMIAATPWLRSSLPADPWQKRYNDIARGSPSLSNGVGGIRFIATFCLSDRQYYPAFCPTKLQSLLGSVHQISWPNLFQRSSVLPFTLTVLLFATRLRLRLKNWK